MSKPKPTPLMSVSAVGNSWIVAKSKSHPGHVYYFNTLTGDAVWNLSESEIRNARKRTQALAKQTGAEPTPNKEPKDNPPTNSITKPLTKNSDPQQISQDIQHHSDVNVINFQEQLPSEYSNVLVNNIQTIDYDNLGNPVNAVNLISSPMVYNAEGWPISQAPIFVTSAIPYLSQGQQMNLGCKQLILPNQSGFNNLNTLNRRFQAYQPRRKYNRWGQRNLHKYGMRQNDLRQQLHFKRKFGNRLSRVKFSPVEADEIDGSSSWNYRTNTRTGDVDSNEADVIEEESMEHEGEQVQDESNTNIHKEELPPNLDLTPLKNLSMPNMTSDICYIVVDFRVLLEEYNFLNAMMRSDKGCYLMVPKNVISELEDYISCSNNVPARRIYYSLMRQAEDGCAFIAEEPSQDYGDSIKNPVLKTCFEVFEQDVHVILITDDSKLLSYKKFIKINVFSVDEIKSLLNYNDDFETVCPPVPKSPNLRPSFVRNKPVDKTVIKDLNDVDSAPKNRSQTEDSAAVKRTADAAIQTEIVTVISQTAKENSKISKAAKVDITNKSNTTQISTESISNPPSKRREIKLKRSISNQPVQSTHSPQRSQKKPFRWRRKRNHSANELSKETSVDNQLLSNCEITSIQTDANNIQSEGQVNEMPSTETENNAPTDDVTESRESSIILTRNNTLEDKITIEETSTSGIISNTDSNVDIEMCSNNFEDTEYETMDIDENHSKIVMYEVSSNDMAETLRAKCEEWVSRFIQIMEDVLAEVLKKEPAFSNIEFRPPWTVHEAAQCIKKYSNDTTVKDVTDKLSILLFRLSDDKGNVTRNMTPWQYMEMYSYGVSLLDAVKVIATNCTHDIQLAEESLLKLLMDIKNPDCSLPSSQGNSKSIEEPNFEVENTELTSPRKKRSRLDNKLTKNYNLRSGRGTPLQDGEKSPNESIEPNQNKELTVKTTFFSKLDLQEISPKANLNESSISTRSKDAIDEGTPLESSTFSREDQNSNINDEADPSTKVTPKIVRNFSKCAEFEERLKDKVTSEFDRFDEYLNYEEDYEYGSENEYDDYDELSDPNITQELDTSDIDISESLVTSSPVPVEPHLVKDSNDMFKFMICLFLQEVKNAINEVKILCDKCYTELKNPQLPAIERNELRKRAESAQTHIVGLSASLNSMLEQNPETQNDSMMSALKKAGINMSHIDKRLLLEYWNTVAEWKKYADVFSFSIKDIITAFKSLSG